MVIKGDTRSLDSSSYHVIDACGHVIRMVLLLAPGKPTRRRMFLPPPSLLWGWGLQASCFSTLSTRQ